MTLSRTLAELSEDFRNEGGFQESRVFNDAVVARYVNVGVSTAYDIMVDSRADYFAKREILSTTAGDGRALLTFLAHPFYRLIRLDLMQGNCGYRLRRVEGIKLDFYEPIKRQVDLRIIYVPTAPRLVERTDCFSHFGVQIAEELVINVALRRAYMHEERPIGAIDAEIAVLSEQLRSAGRKRDQQEPRTMSDFEGGAYGQLAYWLVGEEIQIMEGNGWVT